LSQFQSANSSAARAEAHSIVVAGRNGTRTRSRDAIAPSRVAQLRRCASKPRSSRPTAVAPRLLRRFGPLSHAPLEIFEVVVHLLKCKPQCEEAFRHIAWKSSRETFATKRNDLGSVSSESRLHRVKRCPPASSYAIMRRARPYRGENHGPGKDFHRELDPTPGIREQPGPSGGSPRCSDTSAVGAQADIARTSGVCRRNLVTPRLTAANRAAAAAAWRCCAGRRIS